jgi:hypothetical protein
MVASGSSRGAGGYAEDRYARGLHAWRSRIRPILAVPFGPFILVGVVGLVIGGQPVSWIAGVCRDSAPV